MKFAASSVFRKEIPIMHMTNSKVSETFSGWKVAGCKTGYDG
jgi:hypothetical protein